MSNEETLDPRFCSFCQDRPPMGIMLVVEQFKQDTLWNSEFTACEMCGHRYTDAPVAEHPETGAIAVLQFEHNDFEAGSPVVQKIKNQLDNMVCQVCDEAIDVSDPAVDHLVLATKMVRMNPEADSIRVTCGNCGGAGLCPCCNEDPHD